MLLKDIFERQNINKQNFDRNACIYIVLNRLDLPVAAHYNDNGFIFDRVNLNMVLLLNLNKYRRDQNLQQCTGLLVAHTTLNLRIFDIKSRP